MIREAKDLPARDFTNKSDPFVICKLCTNNDFKASNVYSFETTEKPQTLDPVWMESNPSTFGTDIKKDNVFMLFELFDKDPDNEREYLCESGVIEISSRSTDEVREIKLQT